MSDPKTMPEAMISLAKTIANAARIYGIEMTPQEALQMVQEETINGFRQYLRNSTEKTILDRSDE